MNRQLYFNYISAKLTYLVSRINTMGKLNLLDLNIHSENFFSDLLNKVFSYDLKNLNVIKSNIEGIDLIDEKNKIVAQVSSNCTKNKINSSLSKESLKNYNNFNFKFIAINNDASNLKNKKYDNNYNLKFNPLEDIIDIVTILKTINSLPSEKLYEVYKFIENELGDPPRIEKMDTNLAEVINILSQENLSNNYIKPNKQKFDISEKISFNNLEPLEEDIREYAGYRDILQSIYNEFDTMGFNKSTSILSLIHEIYIKLAIKSTSSLEIYIDIKSELQNIIINSKNYKTIPFEELNLCINIIVADTFVRCKIFKRPQ